MAITRENIQSNNVVILYKYLHRHPAEGEHVVSVSTSDPAQFFPSYCGAGLSHMRLRVRDPPPPAHAQGPHLSHAVHTPSTVLKMNECKRPKKKYVRFQWSKNFDRVDR